MKDHPFKANCFLLLYPLCGPAALFGCASFLPSLQRGEGNAGLIGAFFLLYFALFGFFVSAFFVQNKDFSFSCAVIALCEVVILHFSPLLAICSFPLYAALRSQFFLNVFTGGTLFTLYLLLVFKAFYKRQKREKIQ